MENLVKYIKQSTCYHDRRIPFSFERKGITKRNSLHVLFEIMIDVHCHLEQKDYDKDLDKVIESCKKGSLKAVITSCPNPRDFDKTLEIASKYNGFVFPCFGLHPEYIKEFSEKDVDEYLEKLKENKDKMVGFGEVGLDFHWIRESSWQQKQKEQFKELIRFSKELRKPLVVHCRDAFEETIKVLEDEDAKKVLLHMFGGKNLLPRVTENNWLISINYLVTRSKDYKKIARDMPLENLTLETDAPWNGIQKPTDTITSGEIIFKENKELNLVTLRNDPTSIKLTAQKIAEIKGISFDQVWKVCGENAERFFGI